MPPGFLNHDNVSCYCNALMQISFQETSLLKSLITQEAGPPSEN